VEPSSRRILTWAALALLAGAVRFWGLGAHSLWCDEFLSVASATGGSLVSPIAPGAPTFTGEDFWRANTLAGLREAVARQDGGNGVLHAVALHCWVALFGTSDASVRALSALAGVGLVLLAYALARTLWSDGVAVAGTVLLSLHPMLVHYSREARGYALATAFALAATCVFVRLGREGDAVRARFDAVAYGLLTAAALLSHYLVAAIFAGHLVFALWRVRERRVWKSLAVGWALAVVAVALWMGMGGAEGLHRMGARNEMFRRRVEQQTARRARLPTIPNLAHDLAVIGEHLTGNEVERGAPLSPADTLLLLVPVVLVAAAWRRKPAAGSGHLLLAILAIAAPVQAVVLALWAGHTTALIPRYALFSAPYLLLLMAAGLSTIASGRGAWRVATAAAAVVLAALWARSLPRVGRDAPQFRPPNAYAEGAARLAAVALPGDVVVHPHWESARLCALYLPRGARLVQRVERAEDAAPVRLLRDGRSVLELDLPRPCPRGVFEEPAVSPRSRGPSGPAGPPAPEAPGRAVPP